MSCPKCNQPAGSPHLISCPEYLIKELSASPAGSTAPWMVPPLNEWAIVGMNHYRINGERQLFVSMAKDGRCIKAEGADDKHLWNRLWHQATER